MVRAVADVTVECAPLELAKRYRETTVADCNVIKSRFRLIATMNLCAFIVIHRSRCSRVDGVPGPTTSLREGANKREHRLRIEVEVRAKKRKRVSALGSRGDR